MWFTYGKRQLNQPKKGGTLAFFIHLQFFAVFYVDLGEVDMLSRLKPLIRLNLGRKIESSPSISWVSIVNPLATLLTFLIIRDMKS